MNKYYIGLMSGTSMDGIDVVLLESPKKLVAAQTYPYPEKIQQALKTWSAESSVSAFFQLHRQLGEVFANTVNQFIHDFAMDKKTIIAIGSHGQTLVHAPNAPYPYTVQAGCGHTLSALTDLTVVADFRMRDMVLGGQGAPLAPLYHAVLFDTRPLLVLNLGGIANITLLDKTTRGFDVGPGNSLLDAWAQERFGVPFDKAGEIAAKGGVDADLLAALLNAGETLPKSLDKADFSLPWLKTHLVGRALSDESVQATLVAFTAEKVKQALEGETASTLLVCGGGVHNVTLMQTLQSRLPKLVVKSTEEVGVHPDFIEAMLFAWLAEQALAKKPLDLHPITGGKTTVLGAVFQGG